MTITKFLLARIAEDERPYVTGRLKRRTVRQLRECEAKRRIVELHQNNDEGPTGSCGTCTDRDHLGLVGDEWPCPTIRALAAIYVDHPDCREEWKP